MEAEAREEKARIEAASAAAEELERKAREEARPRSSETQAKYLVIAVSLAESQRDGNSLVISGNPSILQNFLGVKLRKNMFGGTFWKICGTPCTWARDCPQRPDVRQEHTEHPPSTQYNCTAHLVVCRLLTAFLTSSETQS